MQNTFERVSRISDKIFVIPEISHVEHVYSQLPGLGKKNVLIEPGRKGTASCVILALSVIKNNSQKDEPILFLWADHLIRDTDGFVAASRQAAELAASTKKLVFMGVEPSYPSIGFGYMQKGKRLSNGSKNVFELKKFVEKPNREKALLYFDSGNYLWNTGYLTGTLEVFEREMKRNAKNLWEDYCKLLESKNIKETYLNFTSAAIDTALSEKINDALIVPGTFDWADVGSFADLHNVSGQDEEGNHINGSNVLIDHVSNSYIRNDNKKLPVAVVGLDNITVVVNKNGVLVTNNTYAQKVGDIAKKLQT